MAAPQEACETPSNSPLPDSSSLTMAESKATYYGNTYALQECSTNQDIITCYLVYTRTQVGSSDYSITPQWLSGTVLFDNFKEQHKALSGFYCSGRNYSKAVQAINLTKNDWVWLLLKFDGGAIDLRQGRLKFPNDNGGPIELTAPIVKGS